MVAEEIVKDTAGAGRRFALTNAGEPVLASEKSQKAALVGTAF
jgi:hypothetical protein